jgi:flagellar basal body rod protein FlgG
MQRGQEVGRIKLVHVGAKDQLRKTDKSQFLADRGAITGRGGGSVRQFNVEDSSADEIVSLMRMSSAARDVEGNVSMIQAHDRLMDRAINGLGRVS